MSTRLRLPMKPRALVLASAALTLAACADGAAPGNPSTVGVSFTTGLARSGIMATVGSGGGEATLVVGTDTLRLSRVRVVVDHVELAGADSMSCAGGAEAGDDNVSGSHGADDCAELRTGPMVVELPLSDALTAPFSVSVPAGSYHGLEVKVAVPSSGSARETSFRAANPDFATVSVRVEGSYRGRAFSYAAPVDAELEMAFLPALQLDGGSTGLTIQVDVSRWFRDGAGAIIDPATAAPGQPNAELVARNIKASFDAYEDHDRDGEDDHRADHH